MRQASEPPSDASYRVIYRKPYTHALDPKYVVSVYVPPTVHAGIVLDQLRQRHLRPLTHLTPSQVSQIMGWETPTPFSMFRRYLSPPYEQLCRHFPDFAVS